MTREVHSLEWKESSLTLVLELNRPSLLDMCPRGRHGRRCSNSIYEFHGALRVMNVRKDKSRLLLTL
jgi:hypothetical protein